MGNFIVYIIKNDVNDKVYIGQTTQPLKNRFNAHFYSKESNVGKAMREIGKSHFSVSVLDNSSTTLDELLDKERYYIKKYNSIENGYNSTMQRTSERISSRKRINTTLSRKTKNLLYSYSKQTMIPISKIVDSAISEYVEKNRK